MVSALKRGGLISIGLLAGALLAPAAQGADGDYVVPGSKAAGLENCVEPTEFMRRNHMEVIKHQRDATVHQGIRSTKHSLADCVACHVSKGPDQSYLAVSDETQFCGACHGFAAVTLDCFQCHATTPVDPAAGAVAHPGAVKLLPPASGAGAAGEGQRP